MDTLKTVMLVLGFDVAYVKNGDKFLPRFSIIKLADEDKPAAATDTGLIDAGLKSQRYSMAIGGLLSLNFTYMLTLHGQDTN